LEGYVNSNKNTSDNNINIDNCLADRLDLYHVLMTNTNDFNAHFRAIDRANNVQLINAENERLKRQRAYIFVGKADLSKYPIKEPNISNTEHFVDTNKIANEPIPKDITVNDLFRWIDEKANI